MKISFIIQFNQPGYGGVYFSSTSKIKQFIKYNPDFEVDVFNLRGNPPFIFKKLRQLIKGGNFYPKYSIYNGVKCKNIYYSLNIWEYLLSKFDGSFKLDVEKKAKEISLNFQNSNLIAAHYGNGPGEFAFHLSKILDTRFTVMFHGTDIHTTPFLSKKERELYKQMLIRSSLNIFVSKGLMLKSLEIVDIVNKNHFLYNGVDFDLFKRSDKNTIRKKKKELNLPGKVIGFVGNLIEVKNVITLVEIFGNIKRNNVNNVSFVIIGAGHQKSLLQSLFNQENIKVDFLGQLPNAEMPLYFSIMDILVLPSKNEGLPRVIIEALACDVQCVGSRVGGIPELLPQENCFDLNKNFEILMSNRICELISENHSITFEKNLFDFKTIAIKQGKLYRSLIKKE